MTDQPPPPKRPRGRPPKRPRGRPPKYAGQGKRRKAQPATQVMLILRGISGDFALNGVMRHWPNGALDEPSAVEYARRRRFVGQLDVSGEAYDNSPQVLMC